jgi:hypothetical protein
MEVLVTEFKTKALKLNLREDFILEIDFLPNQIIDVYDINQMLRGIYKIGNGRKFKNIVMVGERTWPNINAMKLCCGVEGSRCKIATAFVIENAMQRTAGQFLMNLMNPQKPTRFFANKEQAESWLEKI